MFSTVVLLLSMAAVGAKADYTVSPISNPIGIFFDQIGTLQAIEDTWQVVVYVNMSERIVNNEQLGIMLENIRQVCQRQNHASTCVNGKFKIIENKLKLFNANLNLTMDQLHGNKSSRSRRDVSKPLIGTLDSEEVQIFKDAYKNLEKNITEEQSTLDFEKNFPEKQITLVESELKVGNKSFGSVYANMVSLEEKKSNSTIIHSKIDIDPYLESMDFDLLLAENDLKYVLNAIEQTNNNVLDPKLIGQKTFMEIVRRLKTDTLKIPLSLANKNPYDFLSVCKIQTKVFGEIIQFHIHVPLVNRDDFTLYSSMPLPYKSHGHYVFIKPMSKFIAISESRQWYITLKNTNNCQSISETTSFLCPKEDLPIFSTKNSTLCELNILLDNKNNSGCAEALYVTADIGRGLYLPAQKKDKWVFSINPPENITISCDRKKKPEILEYGTGEISSPKNCEITTANQVLLIKKPIKESDLFKPTNCSSFSCCLNMTSKSVIKLPPKSSETVPIYYEDLISNSRQFKGLEEELKEAGIVKPITYISYATFIVTLIILVVCLVYWVFTKYLTISCEQCLLKIRVKQTKKHIIKRSPIKNGKNGIEEGEEAISLHAGVAI